MSIRMTASAKVQASIPEGEDFMSKLDQIRALREGRSKRRSTGGSRVAEKPRPHAEGLQQEPATPDTASTAKRKPRAAKRRDVGNVAKPEATPTAHRGGHRPSERKAKVAKAAKPKVGRPRVEDRGKTLSDTKPWVAAKMSRASWYRKRSKPSL